LKTLLEESLDKEIDIELNVDDQSTISLITNGIINERLKHIDVKYRFIHDLIKNKIIKLKYCPTNEQKADILTKALNTIKFQNCKNFMVN
jgi:DNA-directed RNA polymerase subunit L